MSTLPSAFVRGAIAGASTFSNDWFLIEHAGGLFRISRTELLKALMGGNVDIVGILGLGAGYYLRLDGTSAVLNFDSSDYINYYRSTNIFSVNIGGGEQFVIGSGLIKMPLIGTTASAANAHIDSGVGNSILRSTSSLVYKRDVENLDSALADAVVDGARPIWYRSKAPADREDWSWVGLLAEELALIEPRLVTFGYQDQHYELVEVPSEEEGEPPRTERRLKADAVMVPDGIAYDRLSVMLLDVARRQKAKVAALEGEVAALQAALTTLTARVDVLEA